MLQHFVTLLTTRDPLRLFVDGFPPESMSNLERLSLGAPVNLDSAEP
jgi:hypothetical protein